MIRKILSRPAVLRYLGLAGAAACAADAVLFGAPTYIRRGVSAITIVRGPNGVLIMSLWVFGLAALCTAWWFGRQLAERGEISRRWILVTAALWILPMLLVPPLASRDMYAYACQGSLFNAGLNPSEVGVSAQPCPWLHSVSTTWRHTPTPYGPLIIALSGFAASFGSQAVALALFRTYSVIALIGLAAVLPVLARRRGVSENRALWLVMCCPLVTVHLVGGGHNDALTVALLVAGLAIAARPGRVVDAVLGGAVIGAAIAVKTTVGVVLPFAMLLVAGGLTFDREGWRRFLRYGGSLLAGTVGAMLVLSYASGLGLRWLVALSGAGESQSWTSPATAVGFVIDASSRALGGNLYLVPDIRLGALILLPLVLLVIWWRSRRGDPLYGAGLACLAVIFLAPITQPWYLFWPLALFAVCAARVRWMLITVVASMFLILPEGDGAWAPVYLVMSALMVVLIGWVAYRAVKWLRSPLPAAEVFERV